MSPEARSARGRAAAEERWRRENERRAAAGLPPTKKHLPEPSAEELEPWLEETDRRFPDREWPHREARRRQAIILYRAALAETIADAMRRTSGGSA